MLGTGHPTDFLLDGLVAGQTADSQVSVFNDLYLVFLVIGTLVGVVVISYILYNANKYRTDEDDVEGGYDVDMEAVEENGEDYEKVTRPELGLLPSEADTKSGKKLFLSFGISATIVIVLVIFAYWNLLLVEGMDNEIEDDLESAIEGSAAESEDLVVEVQANQYAFDYTYPSGANFDSQLVVPEDRVVLLAVTSCRPGTCDGDVMHNWGSRKLRAKADAMPGQYTTTWFVAEETGTYPVICYELCGAGHTDMRNQKEVIAVSDEEFRNWCLADEEAESDLLADADQPDENCMSEEHLDVYLDGDSGGESG